MRWEGLLAACAVGLLAATVMATETDKLPAPWFRTGNATPASQCRTFADKVNGPGFDRNLVIRCDGSTKGFVTVMQQISAEDYRGKRVRLAAQVRGEAIAQWAGLWMRIDGEPGKILAFDNMHGRSLKGTFGWKPASVVLDVAQDARLIAFGVLQDGDGSTYTGGLTLEIVGTDVAVTEGPSGSPLNRKPANLTLSP